MTKIFYVIVLTFLYYTMPRITEKWAFFKAMKINIEFRKPKSDVM